MFCVTSAPRNELSMLGPILYEIQRVDVEAGDLDSAREFLNSQLVTTRPHIFLTSIATAWNSGRPEARPSRPHKLRLCVEREDLNRIPAGFDVRN